MIDDMKKLTLAILLVLTVAVPVAADLVPTADEPTGRMLELKRREGLIRGDEKLFETMLSPNIRYVHSTGLVQTKDEMIAMVAGDKVNYLSIDVEDENYAIYEKSVIVTGTQTIRLKVDGKLITSHSRFTVVYHIIRDKWKCTAYQSTPIPE